MKEQNQNNDMKLASLLSVIVGILLLGFKFYAYHITNSQSVFSDALESIVNVVAGIITFIVIIISLQPADKEHPYGHGKIESMASTFEGGAILLAGVLIIIQSVQAFFHGSHIEEIDSGILIVVGAGLVNGILGYFLYARGNKHHSESLKSSGIHLMTDTLTSVGLVVGLLLVKFTGLQWIDPIVAIIFGGMLSFAGGKILIRSGNILIDATDTETMKLLVTLFEKHYQPGIIQIHFVRVIRSGSHHHIDCHMIIPEFWSVSDAHDFTEDFEKNIIADYPVAGELHIHHDPCRKAFCANCELPNCPIRQAAFIKREALTFEDVAAPMQKK